MNPIRNLVATSLVSLAAGAAAVLVGLLVLTQADALKAMGAGRRLRG